MPPHPFARQNDLKTPRLPPSSNGIPFDLGLIAGKRNDRQFVPTNRPESRHMVIAALSLTLEGRKRQQVVRSLRALSGPTLVEPGCISCRVLEEIGDPTHLQYIELWETTDQLLAHLRSKGYRQVLAAMEESATPPQIQFLWVSEAKGIEFLEAARLSYPSATPQSTTDSNGPVRPSKNGAVNVQGNSREAS